MPLNSIARTSNALRFGILIAGLGGLGAGFLAWRSTERERVLGLQDLNRRARVLAHRLAPAAVEALGRPDAEVASILGSRLDGFSRLLGFSLHRADGRPAAAGKGISEYAETIDAAVARIVAGESEIETLSPAEDLTIHLVARRFPGPEGSGGGILAVLHDASYLEERATAGLVRSAFGVLLATLLLLTLVVALTWFVYERPLRGLAEWMHRLRLGDAEDAPPPGLPLRALAEEGGHLAASLRAARAARWVSTREAVGADRAWTPDRLRSHAVQCLEGRPLIVVSNREPFMHTIREGKPHAIVPASGLVTALDPVLQACGGLWVAHGAGDADHETADSRGRLSVPPGDPKYTLLRIWMTREEEQGYYYGFSNEGLWPLCHLAHERPAFRASDWRSYVEVNRRFADAVLGEIGTGRAVVLVQDYHLALVPRLLKAANPELKVGLFWHIPWPNPEAIRICPWRVELLEGMLGADVVGFHLQQHCNNFLDTVDRMLETRVDWDRFSVDHKSRTTRVRPFPISVQGWGERAVPSGEALAAQVRELKEYHKIEGQKIAVGVDRIDYTKGLPERFRAVGRFLERNPEYRGRFTFIQLGAPSRTHIPRYRALQTELETLADEINWRFQADGWRPIRFLVAHHDAATVHAFLSMADACIVSSLHDGMNLVAKEYVAAQEGKAGALILSEFAGAARELADAFIINPYDGEQFAEAIRQAIELDPAERQRRMERMVKAVRDHNIYRWAAALISDVSQTEAAVPSGDPA